MHSHLTLPCIGCDRAGKRSRVGATAVLTALVRSTLAALQVAVFGATQVGLLTTGSTGAEAQAAQVPSLLVHGFYSGPQTWDRMTERFNAHGVPTQVLRFQTDYGDGIPSQAGFLVGQTAGRLSASPVVVGHSMGGLISRYLTRVQPADALFTVGTPHYGLGLARSGVAFFQSKLFGVAIGTQAVEDGLT